MKTKDNVTIFWKNHEILSPSYIINGKSILEKLKSENPSRYELANEYSSIVLSNPEFCKVLSETTGILGYSDSYNLVLGTGQHPDSPDAFNTTKWSGQNLVGEVLMSIRKIIKDKKYDRSSSLRSKKEW